MTRAIREGRGHEYPSAPHRYRAFIAEKVRDRTVYRREAEPAHAKLAAWRRRQIHRTFGELGSAKADGLVHAPAAFELAKGCSVGCWFCGVAAEKLERTWDYDAESSALWRGTLATFRPAGAELVVRVIFAFWSAAAAAIDSLLLSLPLALNSMPLERCAPLSTTSPLTGSVARVLVRSST